MTPTEPEGKHESESFGGRAIRSHRGGPPAATMCCEARPYLHHRCFLAVWMFEGTTLNTYEKSFPQRKGRLRRRRDDEDEDERNYRTLTKNHVSLSHSGIRAERKKIESPRAF